MGRVYQMLEGLSRGCSDNSLELLNKLIEHPNGVQLLELFKDICEQTQHNQQAAVEIIPLLDDKFKALLIMRGIVKSTKFPISNLPDILRDVAADNRLVPEILAMHANKFGLDNHDS
jgi:hypothetical protein